MSKRWLDEDENERRSETRFAWVLAVVLVALLLFGIWSATHGHNDGNPGDCVATLSKPC